MTWLYSPLQSLGTTVYLVITQAYEKRWEGHVSSDMSLMLVDVWELMVAQGSGLALNRMGKWPSVDKRLLEFNWPTLDFIGPSASNVKEKTVWVVSVNFSISVRGWKHPVVLWSDQITNKQTTGINKTLNKYRETNPVPSNWPHPVYVPHSLLPKLHGKFCPFSLIGYLYAPLRIEFLSTF